MSDLFKTVPSKKWPPLYHLSGELNYRFIVDFLGIKYRDLSIVFGVKESSIRFDERMPVKMKQYLILTGAAIDHIADYFDGNYAKIEAWFKTKNLNIGGCAPVEMVRVGRVERLLQFIVDARTGE